MTKIYDSVPAWTLMEGDQAVVDDTLVVLTLVNVLDNSNTVEVAYTNPDTDVEDNVEFNADEIVDLWMETDDE
jgi:hypothetical protein